MTLGSMRKMMNERFEDMDDTELLKCILSACDQEGCSDTIQELIDRNKGYWRGKFLEAGLTQ